MVTAVEHKRRGGHGRPARGARRGADRPEEIHHPRDPALRAARRRRGSRPSTQTVDDHPRGDRHRFPRRAGARALARRPAPTIDGERVHLRRELLLEQLATAPPPVHPACAQSRAQRRHRRPQHGVRADLRLALRARFREQAALRHARGSAEFHQARLHDAEPAPFGRRHLRTGRRAGAEAASRHRLFRTSSTPTSRSWASSPRPRARRGLRRAVPHPLRRRLHRRRQHGDDLGRQLQLADGVGRDHAVGARASMRATTRRCW